MAEHVNITAKWLQSLESPGAGRVWYADHEIGHFQVCASHTGARIFYRVGRINGKMSRVRIGAYPKITVKVARDLCLVINGDIAAGREVQRTRRSTAGKRTLKDAWEWYLEYHAKPKKRTWKRDVATWKRDVAILGSRTLDEIKRTDVIEMVARAVKANGNGAGNKVIELVRGIYSIAIENEWAVRNPAAKIKKHRPQERDRFLQPDEVPAFFAALSQFRERIRDFFLLCIFTGARRANVMAMRWDELDLQIGLWKIPFEKSKNKQPLIVPLAIQAIEILDRRHDDALDNPWVFPSNASKTGHYVEPKDAWKRVLAKANIKGLTIHDLRRTLGSWQAGQGVSLPIIGKTLGHQSPGSTKIYARLAHEPVRLAIQNATNAIEQAAVPKNS